MICNMFHWCENVSTTGLYRNYQQGDIVDVTVEITAAHLGYFEFRLCPWNNVHEPITHECLDQ